MEVRKAIQKGREYIILEGIQPVPTQDGGNIKEGFIWPHMSGQPNQFGNSSRGFNVKINEDNKALFDFFEEENIKVGEYLPKNAAERAANGEEPKITYSVPVTVDMDHQDWYPCEVYVSRGDDGNFVKLTKDELHELDEVDFKRIDIKCRKKVNARDKSKYLLYLNKAFFYEAVDEFDMEHRGRSDELGMNPPVDDAEEEPFG